MRWGEIAGESQALLSTCFLCPEEQLPVSRPDAGLGWLSQASPHVCWRPGSDGGLGLTALADVTVADSIGATSQAPVPHPQVSSGTSWAFTVVRENIPALLPHMCESRAVFGANVRL